MSVGAVVGTLLARLLHAALPEGGHASTSDQPVPPGPATAPRIIEDRGKESYRPWRPRTRTGLYEEGTGRCGSGPCSGGVVAGACTGLLNQAGHPDITIRGDRLIVVAWLLPVLGLPLLLERLTAPRASLDVVTAS